MILCEDLHFDYGSKPILRGANFHVHRGELAVLLGRNGSGKSTTLRLLGGLLRLGSGQVRVAGMSPWDADERFRRRVGLLPDGLGLFEELTLEEQLELVGRLHGLSRVDCETRSAELAEILGLREALWGRACVASHGTRKKAALAMTLLPDPEVLLLDEPFEGVDPASVRCIEALFQTLTTRGRTILFSAHDLDLVMRMAPRVLLLGSDGAIVERTLASLDWSDFQGAEPFPGTPEWLGSSSF